MSSNIPEFLDQQAEALARIGQDLTARHCLDAAAEFRALERRVDELETENTLFARRVQQMQATNDTLAARIAAATSNLQAVV